MKRYYTTPLLVYSTIGGIVAYLLLSGFCDTPTAVLFSALTTLGISIVVPALFARADKKFLPLKKEIKEPILIDERVNYIVGEEIKQGFIVATRESLFVISSNDKMPIKFEIKKSDVKKISVTDGVYINIFLDYDKCIRMLAGDGERLSSMLHSEGFGK